MEEAAQKLGNTKIRDRKLECRTAIDKKSKPWRCYVKIGNLNVETTPEELKVVTGKRRPQNVKFGVNSYSSTAEHIGQAIQRLLSSVGTVEAWYQPGDTSSAQIKATATYSTMELATKAVTELNGYKLPQLGGSKILLSRVVKAKFSILSSMHSAIAPELANVQRSLGSSNYLEIKSFPSADQSQRFTSLQIISDTAQEVGRAKAVVEKILNGHTASGGRGIIWNELFLKVEGMAYLKDLGTQHDVFIYRNAKKCVLSLYGDEENKAMVESALLKTVEDLAVSTFRIDLDDKVPLAALQTRYHRIVGKLGKTVARLNVTTSTRTITIHGSAQDADWAKAILKEESIQASGSDAPIEENQKCPVCWEDVMDSYTTPCGHAYDKECFQNQCLSAGDNGIPIRCMACEVTFPFGDLAAALTRDQFEKLLQNSFTNHVRKHPGKYQYCPTADCDQVYEVLDDGKIFTCFTCLTSICTKCGAVAHEGLTCDQYKAVKLGDEGFAQWKKASGAQDCPKCSCTIEKSEGCNHIECTGCGAHICWVCLATFARGSDTYGHMTAEHGSFYDPGYGDD